MPGPRSRSEEAELVQVSAAPVDALGQQERARVDVAIETAHKYPRDMEASVKEAIAITEMDPELAEQSFYYLERQGKPIEGPSVRAAETAVCAMGNVWAGSRILEPDRAQGVIRAQGFCHDLEKNVLIMVETTRRITRSSGDLYSDDMVEVTGKAAAAIAFRDAAFKALPKVITKAIYRIAREVVAGKSTGTIKQRWARAVQSFSKWGVTEDMLLKFLKRKSLRSVKGDDLAKLTGLRNAIQEGADIEESFPELRMDEPKPTKGKAAASGGKPAKDPAKMARPELLIACEQLEHSLPGGPAKRARERLGLAADVARAELSDDELRRLYIELSQAE